MKNAVSYFRGGGRHSAVHVEMISAVDFNIHCRSFVSRCISISAVDAEFSAVDVANSAVHVDFRDGI